MAWNYRKSVRLGRGGRINLSKRGLGFSYGIPGFRITKSANGRVSRTRSIPGTGFYNRETISSPTNKKQKSNKNSFQYEHTLGMFRANGRIEATDNLVTERTEVLKMPKKFWTVLVALMMIGSIGADFGDTSPSGPSKMSSVIYSFFMIGIFIYRIFRHISPRRVQVTKVRVETSPTIHLESGAN